jgi:predicted ester cyclase
MRDIKTTVLYKWFHEVWNNNNEDAIEELMTSDSFAHGILAKDQANGPDGFKLFYKDFKNQFRDIRIEVEEVIAQDEFESARTTVNAIHAATGKNVSFSGICMARIKNDQIAEAWNQYDFLNLYQQIGLKLVPADVAQ